MSNHHLRNMEISLKAKGLLSVMLSLPDNWDYTIKGLSIINKEGLDSIRSTIHELEMAGYVERKRTRDPRGRFHTSEYIIREKPVSPVSEKPTLDIPTQVNPMSGIPTQISKEEILNIWKDFAGRAQELELPHAPKQFLNYFEEDNMPQTKLNRDLEGGMAISIGRLREDTQYDYKFVCLSHNTLRGAAGGAVLMAELLCAEGYMD